MRHCADEKPFGNCPTSYDPEKVIALDSHCSPLDSFKSHPPSLTTGPSHSHINVKSLASKPNMMEKLVHKEYGKPSGNQSCLFPILNTRFEGEDVHTSVPVRFEAEDTIASFCKSRAIEPSRLIQLVWSVVLRFYTGMDYPFFAYIDDRAQLAKSNRGVTACGLDLTEDKHVLDLLESIACWDEDFTTTSERQRLNTIVVWNCGAELGREVYDDPQCNVKSFSFTDEWKYGVSIEAHDSGVGWIMSLRYWKSILERKQAIQVANLVQHIASAIVHHGRLSSIEPCSVQTIQQLSEWNSHIPEKINSCVHELILEQCRARHDTHAVCAWDGDFTYQDINELSYSLAQHLKSHGLGPEKFVGLYFEKSKWTIVALLAVMRAGGAFVFLDTSYPLSRLREMCRTVEATLVLSSRLLAVDATALELDVISVDNEQLAELRGMSLSHERELSEDSIVKSYHALFAVFTSGSTGTPKGILINHMSFCSGQTKLAKIMGMDATSRVLQFASFAFDLSIQELLTTLVVGGCVCIPSESARRSNIPLAVSQLRVNFLSLTPTVARLLAPSDVPSIMTLQLVGEPLLPTDVTSWASRVRLFNGYGPAECCMCAATRLIPSNDSHPAIIGSAVGSLCWITDPSDPQKLAPIGAIGELLVEGPIVGKGYAKAPEKTNESFIASPRWRSSFPGNPSIRMCRTGDLVQYVSNGEMRFVGRRDAQAKLHGQRLELGEVEHCLRESFPQGTQAVADMVTLACSNDNPILVGFISLPTSHHTGKRDASQEDEIFVSQNKEFQAMACIATSELASRLPQFMVPSVLVQVSAICMTSSGKTDRKKLRQIASLFTRQQLESFTEDHVARRSPVSSSEKLLHQLIEKVLRVTEFGMNDDFFKLGGDSVLAMELSRKAREDHGVHLPGDAVFKSPILSALALTIKNIHLDDEVAPFSLLGKTESKDQVIEAIMITCHLSSTTEIEDVYPCTPLQEGIMALSLMGQASDYTTVSVFRLPRAIDIDKLKMAWNTVFQSNEIMRTRIVQTTSGRTYQAVVKSDLPWRLAQTLEECVNRDLHQGMRLGDPLLQLYMVQDELCDLLVLRIHHTLYDGWSLPRTLAHVESAYYGDESQSRPFKTFISYLLQQDSSRMNDFWRKHLQDFSAPLFPSPPSGKYSYRPTSIQAIKRTMNVHAPKDLGVTLATIIRLSWALTMSQYSGSDDVVFGAALAGRNVPVKGIDQILGPSITTIPLRVQIQRSMKVLEMLRLLHEQSVKTMDFEQMGLQRIAATGPGAAAACQFQSLLIVQPAEVKGASSIFGHIVEEYAAENAESYILTFETRFGRADSLHLEAAYDTNVITELQMNRILQQFSHNLLEVTNGIGKELHQLNGVNPEDLQTLQMWNNHLPEAVNCCIHDMVYRQCLSQPFKKAVAAWDGSLTYKELNIASNNLAAVLQEDGVCPGMYVMVYVGKSVLVVVAIMAVLKAGGAFVLIDPTQPTTRLQQICEDTEAKVVVASEQHLQGAATLGLQAVKVGFSDDCTESRHLAEPAVTPKNAAYSVFTSGSTGRPKGVIIQHRAFVTSAIGSSASQLMDRDSRVLQFASYSFDASISEILYPLIIGACVCIPKESDCRNNLEKAMNELQVTWTTLTPSVARTLTPSKLTTLRTLSLGGEAMSKVDVDQWANRIQLVNSYGPAECSVDTTTQPGISLDADPSNIGRSAAAVCWVVDPQDPQILKPIGAIGELVVEGPILFQGYLKDPAKTVSSLLESPNWLRRLRHGKSGRIYRTGDLVQYCPKGDGTICYVGRKDSQVKLRGQRIELGDVEQHLRECLPEAKEVIAEIIKPSDTGAEPTLAAFILINSNGVSSEGDFLAEVSPAVWSLVESAENKLRTRLPSFMVPSLFLPLSKVPITIAGKTDRRLLREKSSTLSRKGLRAHSRLSSFKRPPATVQESVLQKAVVFVLNLSSDEVGMEDNFFYLGGDSITAMKLVGLIRDVAFILTVGNILTYPRLADLAQAMCPQADDLAPDTLAPFSLLQPDDQKTAIQASVDQCHIDPDCIEDIYPCTAMQEALLALSMRQRGDYVATLVFDMPHSVDMDCLQLAWQSVYDANPILRTRLIQAPGNVLLQVVLREKICWSSDSGSLKVGHGKPLSRLCVTRNKDQWQLRVWLHHALYDGSSLPSILQQVEAAYKGEELQVHPYNTFAAYTGALDSEVCRKFWANEFKDLHATQFPPPQARPDHSPSRETVTHSFSVPQASGHDFTLPTMIQLACAAVLGHCTASDDVVFGLTLHGRSALIKGIETLVGPTITTVPFRVRLPPKRIVRECLLEIQSHLTELVPYEQFGMQRIRTINSETDSACGFKCHLIIQPGTGNSDEQGALFKEPTAEGDIYTSFSTSPLVLIYTVSGDKRSVELTSIWEVSCFSRAEATTLSHQLEHVLQQIMCEPERPLEDIEVISPHDISRLVSCNTIVPPRLNRLLHESIFEQCKLRPAQEAISSWDGSFTYGELYEASCRLTQHFITLGIGLKSVTAVCMARSRWAVVAILSVLATGSACTLLDPSHPSERIQEVIVQTGAKFVVLSLQSASLAGTLSCDAITLSASLMDTLPLVQSQIARLVNPTDAAFIFFTSGSTGRPKGMVMEHGCIATGLNALRGCLGLDEHSRVLHFASYAFDFSVFEIIGSLTFGAHLCIPSDTDRTSDLAGFIQRHQVNWCFLVPSVARLLDPSSVPSLRTLVLGGEPVSTMDVDRWAGKLSLINGYGPAECTFICVSGRLPATGWVPGTLGCVVSGVGWITTPSNPEKLSAWGAVGELLIEGHILAREYLGDPEKTAASFVRNPPWLSQFRTQGEARLYRTGDLVQYTGHGLIKYLGRTDRQVKLNGQRIELGEVECHMNKCFPGAVVIAEMISSQSLDTGRRQLCAFVCLDDEDGGCSKGKPVLSSSDEEFRRLCRAANDELSRKLPHYMIPATFVPLSHVPITGSGKIDRRLLVELAGSPEGWKLSPLSSISSAIVPPRTKMESQLVDLWAEVLSLGSVSTSDSFFHVGGDSVLAMHLVANARRREIKLTVSMIFSNPRLSDLALAAAGEVIECSVRSHDNVQPFALLPEHVKESILLAAEEQCAVGTGDIEDAYPCTPLQEGLLSRSMRTTGAYHASFKYSFPATLDIRQFQEAWREVAKANPILRTRLVQGCSLLQVVLRRDVPWSTVNNLDEYASALRTKEMRLGQPLVQLAINEPADGEAREFSLVIHHALYDGLSLNLLLNQVQQVYTGRRVPYQPFNRFIRYISQSNTESCKNYWLKQLAGVSGAAFPPLPSSDYKPFTDSTIRQTAVLKATPGITTATVLQLGWAMVNSQYTDSSNVVFGLIVSGRSGSLEGIESVTGPTITTVPLHFRLNSEQSVRRELLRLQKQSTVMASFEQFGLQGIRRLGGDARTACQFQNLLMIQPPMAGLDEGFWMPLDDDETRSAGDFSTYALEVECRIVSDGIVSITFDFDKKVLPEQQARRVLSQFVHILQQFQCGLETPMAHLELISPAIQREMMDWNASLTEPVEECVHRGIKQHCLDSPNAMAVCAWDGDFTYRELDELSLHLALHLQTLGVGPEFFVPILAEKTRWVAIAIMGVIRAGGAITLLDPSIPLQRLQTICHSVDAKIVISADMCGSTATQLAPKVVMMGDGHLSWNNQQECKTEIACRVTPQNALYAIFTSGSTGKPKGIVIEHAAFYTSCIALRERLHWRSSTRTLQFSSHMFDVCLSDYLWTFIAGGCVCIASKDSLRNNLSGAIRDLQVNRLDMTPSIVRVLRPEHVPAVQSVILGGEPLSRLDVETWAGKVQLVNSYGPSEASVSCAAADVNLRSDPSSIGHVFGVASWIVDKSDHNKLVPIGAVGELVLEGYTLARGYLDDPEKTAQVVPSSSPAWLQGLRPHSRLYKTGDLVQYNSNGSIRFIGRKDTQVKIRGQRVELGEIEHHIRQSSCRIRDVVTEVVTPSSYRGSGQVLTAFICDDETTRDDELVGSQENGTALFRPSKPDHRKESQRITSMLKKLLPAYMVPDVFISLSYMPLSASGKADRRRLRERAATLSKKDMEAYQARDVVQRFPETSEELSLQGLVAEVLHLNLEDIGMEDNFFSLGGDSITSIRFVERARAAGFAFRVTDVFENPQLSQLATFIAAPSACGEDSDIVPPPEHADENNMKRDELVKNITMLKSWKFTKEQIVDILPVTQSAERVLFQPPEYWILNLQGPVDLDLLQTACTALVRRHAILRSVFASNERQSLQIVLSLIDSRIEREETSSDIAEFADEYRLSDNITLPTLDTTVTRFVFVQNSQGQKALIIRLSHAQFDGYCLPTLWRDLKHLYEGVSLAPAAEYSLHLNMWRRSHTEHAFAFWRSTLEGSEVSRIGDVTFGGRKQAVNHKLITTTRQVHLQSVIPNQITTATVIKAAWSFLLAQLTGRNDVVFAQLSNGRNNASVSTQGVVGMCLNYIPVRARFDSTWTALDLMQFLQHQHRESLDFELLDFRQIVEHATSWPKGTTHQSIVVHQNIDPDVPFTFGSAQAHVTCSYEWPQPPDEILIESRPVDGGDLQVTLDTCSNILSQYHADIVLESLCYVMTLFSTSPESRLKPPSIWPTQLTVAAADT